MNEEVSSARLQLAAWVMRRSAWVAAGFILVALGLGLLRLQQDVSEELSAARALTQAMGTLAGLPQLDDESARRQLAALDSNVALRHVVLSVQDAQGRELLAKVNPRTTDAVMWALPRPDGGHWTVTMVASPRAEREEALLNLGGALALLTMAALALLAVMHANVRRAFRPLKMLLGAIEGVQRGDFQPLRGLPTMPVDELESLATALRHLAQSLEDAQDRRRVLGQKMITLQEDERQHLARELHDELGQQLSSMRVDAAWLVRKIPASDPAHEVVLNLARQCEDLQVDVRQMLVRLRPLGPACGPVSGPGSSSGSGPDEGAVRLQELLQALARAWAASAARSRPAVEIDWRLEFSDPNQPLPQALVLAVYRLTQEALTNISRHSQATEARVELRVAASEVVWQVQDNGIGLPDATSALQRGNGLAGMQERVWALGGEFILAASPVRVCQDGRPPAPLVPQGLVLRARFDQKVPANPTLN